MKEHKVRFINESDKQSFAEWFDNTPNNLRDKTILDYPSLRVLCAYDDTEGPHAYLPVQTALVLESLAVKPGLRPLDAAASFKDLVKGAELLASMGGVREMYFACADEGVIGIAERHGFEVLPWKVLRMRLK